MLVLLTICSVVKITSSANNNRKWEESSDLLCHNCAHCFSTVPVYIPWVDKAGAVTLSGNFCSFNCGKSWILARPKGHKANLLSLYLMARKLFGQNHCRFDAAPAKETLKAFGGSLSIESYRESFLVIVSWESLKKLQFKHMPLKKICTTISRPKMTDLLPPSFNLESVPAPTINRKHRKSSNIISLLGVKKN